jgi:transcriptional regulator with XRE-family HTH domain
MSHMASAFPDNTGMKKTTSRQILADNLERLKKERGFSSYNQIAKRAKVGQSHVSRLVLLKSAATIDMLDALADALGVQTWELLTDDEATRKAALERMILGPRLPDDEAEKHLPPAPQKVRKRSGGGD